MIAQIKFVATYLVPGLYPALLLGLSTVIGAISSTLGFAPLPGSEWPFVLNVLFWMGVLSLAATLTLTLKKLFGRQPSLNEVLGGLISVKAFDAYREEMRLRCLGLEKQISDARHEFDERSNSDLVHADQRFREILDLSEKRSVESQSLIKTVSRLEERTESHIRKLDQYDGKLDNLLKEVTRHARNSS